MSLLPRRGTGRHGQHGVAVHPGWTLSPTSVTDAVHERPIVDAAPVAEPTSRWTSTPAAVAVSVPAATVPVVAAAPAPVEPVSSWATEWEAVASTPVPGAPVSALHNAAVTALDAVFGVAAQPSAWDVAQLLPTPVPAPVASATLGLTALDRPLDSLAEQAATPLAAEAARAVPARTIPVVAMPLPLRPAPPSTPPPTPTHAAAPAIPAPPTTPPPPRTVLVPAPAQQLVDRAIRTAPAAPAQRRSTVRLGFTDASVIDLRPDDPIAKALHTVAKALMGRDH